ncbi:MAG: erythromycin esterase family protein [Balneolaceae bacterium]|nr:MAG: erythromycin esterase family protein [Balneolaceae bacterium]
MYSVLTFFLFPLLLLTSDPRTELLQRSIISLENPENLVQITDRAADARIVLLGEATHGTSEFYVWRDRISRELIENKGFNFILVEGDWSSAYRVNRYIRQLPGAPATAAEALEGFNRWPQWMWNNREVLDMVEWLRSYNDGKSAGEKVGFYGMDMYAMWESIGQVTAKAGQHDSRIGNRLQAKYECLTRFGEDHRAYLESVARGGQHCGNNAENALALIREGMGGLAESDPAAWFNLEQQALVVRNAERHYRAMLSGGAGSWNERVDHFKATLNRMLEFKGEGSKGIVWAHNTHVGDARATDMAGAGMRNIGQLSRQKYGAEQVFSIGFGTYEGQVLAGRQWGDQMQVMDIPPAANGSLEALLNTMSPDVFAVHLGEDFAGVFSDPIGHRAIGVTYNPVTEARQNYVSTVWPQRYDAFIFIKNTGVLEALGEQ